ncbi:PAS domain-containing sensor histidine kinase [Arenibaculum pallidiluteum]|uniref:PAS domain-containing sensor histidine kinase n=1 Tax=Arenibaculum pallidiluteum TaxID=2812559 RepID=UPI001A976B35|nr:histidine kinase dimerization/phosphoacceptor domain -containing protein [Arenibaculum pallidiluteum]
MPIHLLPENGDTSGKPVDISDLVVENAADSIFVMDLEGRTVFANPAAEQTFGWSRQELCGRLLHDVVHYQRPDGHPFPLSECALGRVFASRETLRNHEDVFFHRSGQAIHVACSNAPVLHEGTMIGAVLIAVDITERKMMEQKLAQANAAKEALIREVHHRVKNSLMMVVSLLRLQAQKVSDAELKRHFDEACSRVAIVARMHERLYRVEDVESVEFAEFLRDLCEEIAGSTGLADRVALEVEAEAKILPTDLALPLALVVNELVTNAIKHGFPAPRTGRIRVGFRSFAKGWELQVVDDGIGIPDGFDASKTGTLGMRLISTLARQVGASLAFAEGSGTSISLRAAD